MREAKEFIWVGALRRGKGYPVVTSSFPLPSTSLGPSSEETWTTEERELPSYRRAFGRFEQIDSRIIDQKLLVGIGAS